MEETKQSTMDGTQIEDDSSADSSEELLTPSPAVVPTVTVTDTTIDASVQDPNQSTNYSNVNSKGAFKEEPTSSKPRASSKRRTKKKEQGNDPNKDQANNDIDQKPRRRKTKSSKKKADDSLNDPDDNIKNNNNQSTNSLKNKDADNTNLASSSSDLPPPTKNKSRSNTKENSTKNNVKKTSNGPGSNTGVFMITFNGQIETADFQFHDNLYCTFGFSHGTDWQVIAGIQEGMTQVTRKASSSSELFTWNFPIDITFKSTNPFGWPRIFLQVYGTDTFGREVVRGYGSTNLPLTPGSHKLEISMFVPLPSSFLRSLSGYFFGDRAEFIDPKFVTSGIGREVTRVQSQGSVSLNISVISKDLARYGFSRS